MSTSLVPLARVSMNRYPYETLHRATCPNVRRANQYHVEYLDAEQASRAVDDIRRDIHKCLQATDENGRTGYDWDVLRPYLTLATQRKDAERAAARLHSDAQRLYWLEREAKGLRTSLLARDGGREALDAYTADVTTRGTGGPDVEVIVQFRSEYRTWKV